LKKPQTDFTGVRDQPSIIILMVINKYGSRNGKTALGKYVTPNASTRTKGWKLCITRTGLT